MLNTMLGELTRLDPSLKQRARHYVLQASLAALTLCLVLVVNDALSNTAVATGIAASAFLVFVGPSSKLGETRRVIGGHFVGSVIGLSVGLALRALDLHGSLLPNAVAAGAVGLGIIVMAVTDTEHPPAAGTILGLVLGPQLLASALLVVLSVSLITASRRLLRRWLIDLI